MPDFNDFKKNTLQENLQQSLSDAIDNVNTSTNIDVEPQAGPTVIGGNIEEKSMFQGLGSGLWDFTREAGQSFVDTAAFGIPSAVTGWDPADDAGDSLGGKIGQAVGGAAGFLVPFGLIGKGVRGAGRVLAGTKSTTAVEKGLSKAVEDVVKKSGALKYSKGAESTVKSDDILQSFNKHVLGEFTKPIANFDKAFKTAAQKNEFFTSFNKNAYEELMNLAKQKGFQINGKQTKEALETVLKEFDMPGRPISGMAGLIAKKLGDGPIANFYSHLAEEAITFGIVENMMHGIDVASGEVDADFMGTTAHAVLMGHALGAVRFIPGGVDGGMLGIMRGTAPQRISRLIKESDTYAMNYDLTTRAGQKAILQQYSIFANIKDMPIRGGPFNIFLQNEATRATRINSKMKSGDYTFRNLRDIINKKGKANTKEKVAAAELMQHGLRSTHSSMRKEWNELFIKDWAKDIAASSPRMFIGGVTMSGGPQVVFSDEVSFDDKIISIMMGAFLMKNGKTLQYKNKLDGTYVDYHPLGIKPLKDFDSRLIEQEQMLKALGADTTDNPIWSNLAVKAIHENNTSSIARELNPSDLDAIAPLINYAANSKLIVKADRKITEPSKKAKGSIGGEWGEIYAEFASHTNKESIIGEGKRLQEWSELSLAKKKAFRKEMLRQKIETTEDIFEMYVQANNKNITEIQQANQETVEGVANIFGGFNKIPTDSGRQQLKEIKVVGNAKLTDADIIAIQEYNSLVNLHTKNGKNRRDPIAFEITADTPKESLKQMQEVLLKGKERINEVFQINDVQRQFDYSSEFLHDAMDQLHLTNAITKAAKDMPALFKGDLKGASKAEMKLFRQILMDESGIAIPGKIEVSGKRSGYLNKQMEQILNVVRMFEQNKSSIKGNTKTITPKEAREALRILENNDILAFGRLGEYSNKIDIDVIGKHVGIRYNRELLRNGKTNDGRRLDAKDRQILQELENIGITQQLTLRPLIQAIYDMKVEGVLGKVKTDGIDSVIKTLESAPGGNKTFVEILNQIKNSKDKEGIETVDLATELINSINATIQPYIKISGKEGGVLNKSTSETSGLSLGNLVSLNETLNFVKTGMLQSNANKFIVALANSPQAEFSKTYKQVHRQILDIIGPNKSPNSVQDVYTLAVEYGLWNRKKGEFENRTDSELKTIRDNMFEARLKKFTNSEKEVSDLVELLTKERIEPGETKAVKIGDILGKYNAGEYNRDGSDLTHEQQLQAKFIQKHNRNIDTFVADFKREVLNAVQPDGVKPPTASELTLAAQTYALRQIDRIEIEKITANAQAGNNWITRPDYIQNTQVVRALNEGIGVDGVLRIVDGTGVDVNGYRASLSKAEVIENIIEKAYQGDYFGNNQGFDANKIAAGQNNEAFVMYNYGLNNYSFAIPKTESVMLSLGQKYGELLTKIRKDKSIKEFGEKEYTDALEAAGIKETSKGVFELKLSDSWEIGTNQIHKIMNDMTMNQVMKDIWWSDVRNNVQNKDAIKLLKRTGLFNNIGATNYSTQSIKQVVKNLGRKRNPIEFADKKDVVTELDNFSKGKWKQVTVRDEAGDVIDSLHSINSRIDADFAKSIKDVEARQKKLKNKKNKTPADKQEIQELQVLQESLVNERLDYKSLIGKGISDASDVNGVTFVGPNQYKALAYLAGEINSQATGGIKPIVLNIGGKNQFFVNKTAFVKNKFLNKVFSQNKDVAWITFTSASKQIGSQMHTPLLDANLLFNSPKGIDSKFKAQIVPEAVQFVSIKGDKLKGTLSLNHSSHVQNTTARKDIWNARFQRDVSDTMREINQLKQVSSSPRAIATFKILTQNRADNRASEMGDMLNQESIMNALAKNDVMPHLMARAWENMVKSDKIDPLFKKKVKYGGQSVMAPDFGGSVRLKNTVIAGGEIYQVGEVELSFNQRAKPFTSERLIFNKEQTGAKDTQIDFSELSTNQQNQINKFKNFGEVADWAIKNKLKVLVAGERNPITKPSSVMPLAVKGFRAKDEGNVIVVNAVDVKRAAEGDYDIDTMNFFWDNPRSAMKEYFRGRAEVQDSQVPKLNETDASYRNVDFNDAGSMRTYRELKQQAEYMRGSLMNAQRILQWFQANKSAKSSATKDTDGNAVGLLFKVPGKNRYITIRQDVTETNKRLANLNQRILDADNGFDVNTFRDLDTVYRDIFFHEKHGFFQVATLNKFTKGGKEEMRVSREPGAEFDAREIDVISQTLINPYRNLLQLSNKVYSQGKGEKVGLRDLVSGAEEFTFDMIRANKKAQQMFKKAGFEKDAIETDIFQGFSEYARLDNTSKGYNNTMIYDRLISNVIKTRNLLLNKSQKDRTSDIEFAKEMGEFDVISIGDLKQSTMQKQIQLIPDHMKRVQIATAMNKRIQRLEKLNKHQYSNGPNNVGNNYNSTNHFQRRIEKLKSQHRMLLKEIDLKKVDPKALNIIKKRVFEQKTKEALRQNKFQPLSDKQIEQVGKDTEAAMSKGVDTDGKPIDITRGTYVESARSEDVINAIAMTEAFGFSSLQNISRNNASRSEYAKLEFEIRDLKREYNKAWKQFNNLKNVEWVNENHIQKEFFEKIDRLLENVESPEMRNWAIARIMTPEYNMTKVVEYNGMLFPAPMMSGANKFINLGLGYVIKSPYYDTRSQDMFIKGLGESYNRIYKKLNNGTPGLLKNDARGVDVESTYYFEPFTMPKDHSRRMLIGALSPSALRADMGSKYSRLDAYEKLHQTFGSGMIRDIVNNSELTQIPTSLVAGSRQYTLGGYESLMRAQKEGEKAFITDITERQGGVSILRSASEVSIDNVSPVGGSSREARTPSQSTSEKMKRLTKEVCD